MDILIKQVYISNFRSIKEVEFTLNRTNLLIGKNNSGKSNILKALEIAFNYQALTNEDLYVSQIEPYSKDREIIIDILIEASNVTGDFSVEWATYLGEAVKQYIVSDQDYFAFRTVLKYDEARDLFINRKYLINSWENKTISRVNLNRGILDNIRAYIIDAKRDIYEDINNKKSLWSKSTNNFNIDDTVRSSLENSLCSLNDEMINGISELGIIKGNLVNTSSMPEVDITIYPLTKDLSSLYRGMNIYYKVPYGNDVSVENNGMGVRSVAVLSTYKSYIEIEKLKFDSVNDVVYNLLLIEEPETHVHPQAQKHIYSKISELPAQVITTTHSPYIIYKSNLADILIANMDNAETKTDNIDLSTLNEEEIIAINKFVLLTKGDILFSNLVVLCEGITEELLLPEFINDLVGKPTDQLGINVVGVSGQNYKPFIQVLSSLSIPWILLSDGESLVVNQMKNTVKQVLNIDDNHFNAMSNIFVLPEDHDIEYYLYSNYKNDIHQVLYELLGEEEYNYQKESLNGNIRKKKYLAKFNNVLIRDYDNEPQNTEVLDILYSNKGQFGKEIARKILSLENPRRVPSIIGDICNEIKSIMGMGED